MRSAGATKIFLKDAHTEVTQGRQLTDLVLLVVESTPRVAQLVVDVVVDAQHDVLALHVGQRL